VSKLVDLSSFIVLWMVNGNNVWMSVIVDLMERITCSIVRDSGDEIVK
jgi:hypothetical protein